jgi:hypothetical protein
MFTPPPRHPHACFMVPWLSASVAEGPTPHSIGTRAHMTDMTAAGGAGSVVDPPVGPSVPPQRPASNGFVVVRPSVTFPLGSTVRRRATGAFGDPAPPL